MNRIASYRVQLRNGMDFQALGGRLDYIAGLGVSHLYLSPILTAAPGSTHGYDVTDPTTIDPSLGGREGFEALSRAAQDRGLKIILDIVPNHMAFGLDTPWFCDVLRHGVQSVHAPVFDIDWDAGPLALPWLTAPLPELFEAGEVRLEGDHLRVQDLRVPLAPGTVVDTFDNSSTDDLADLERRQHWQLLPWQMERDSITHRRFFSVTSLIGVRVEDPAVFEASHEAVFSLVDGGFVQGLRIDHIDGLVDPAGYLRCLADRLPQTSIWIEKILVAGEALPDWPVLGTTGYEAAAMIARCLTNPAGLKRIDAIWRGATMFDGDFHTAVAAAKREVLSDELAAELRQLRGMAEELAATENRPVGPETLRESLTELLVAFPRYRSYIGNTASPEDTQIWGESANLAAESVRDRTVIDWIVDRILSADSDAARRLGNRMEQVTGALLAKAHEDTAGFRFNRYLAVNEVGADPDEPFVSQEIVQDHLDERLRRWPSSLTAGSSHDTKRSEDTRSRLIAMSHDPSAFETLWTDAAQIAGSAEIKPNLRFYAIQVAIGIWGEPDAADRLADHMVKALREGKEVSYWTAPNDEQETALENWIRALAASWDDAKPAPLIRLCKFGEMISLAETALRLVWPGMPDIYQGGEWPLFQLTDPDNRRPPGWDKLEELPNDDRFASRKNSLIRTLLNVRRDIPDVFDHGSAEWSAGRSCCVLSRRSGSDVVSVSIGSERPTGETLWSDPGSHGTFGIAVLLGRSGVVG